MLRRLSMLPLLIMLLIGTVAMGMAPVATTRAQGTSGDHVLRIEYNSYPDTLDPPQINDSAQIAVGALAFEGLTRIDAELQTVPGAAESWDFSPDGLTLTFQLREDLVYSDGSPLTAERFRFPIERVCDPRTASPWAPTFFDIAGCEAFFTSPDLEGDDTEATPADATENTVWTVARANLGVRALDERTLELRLVRPAAYMPTALSLFVFWPVKQELIDAGGADWWRDPANLVSNGPFRIESLGNDTDVPSQMVFAANDRYWGGRPKLDRIEYVMANEDRTATQRLEAYRQGEIDMVWLAYEAFPLVEADPELARDLLFAPRAATFHLAFTLTREPFQDPKVREAFAYGFDREAFCRVIQYSICTPALSWIPPGVPGHIETDAFAFDPQKARQALADSSYGGPERLPEITWYYWGDGAEGIASREGGEWLAAQYRAVLGIEIRLVEVTDDEWTALHENPETRPQFGEWAWFQDYPDPQNWLSTYWTCDATVNGIEGGYCNPELDALLAQADAELDPETRLALYEEAGHLLVADVPTIFLYHRTNAVLVKPFVTGYVATPVDFWPGQQTLLTIDVERPA